MYKNLGKELLILRLKHLKREMKGIQKHMEEYKDEDANFSARVRSKAIELKDSANMLQDWIDGIKEEMEDEK